MDVRTQMDQLHNRFRQDPCPVFFSPALEPHTDKHRETLDLVRQGPWYKDL
ncbi:MAG: hypothetical protein Rhims3KO_36060 [Hyphomicrobiales bacterium]